MALSSRCLMGLSCMVSWWNTLMDYEMFRSLSRSWQINLVNQLIGLRCDRKLTGFLDTKSSSRESCCRPRWCHSAWLAPPSNSPSHQPYHKHWLCCPDWLCFRNTDMGNRNHQRCLEFLWRHVGLVVWCKKIWSRWTTGFGLFRRARWLGG